MKLKKFLLYFFCVAATLGAAVIMTLSMMFYGGHIDINALHNQSGLKYGEGWLEVIMFWLFGLCGLHACKEFISEEKL